MHKTGKSLFFLSGFLGGDLLRKILPPLERKLKHHTKEIAEQKIQDQATGKTQEEKGKDDGKYHHHLALGWVASCRTHLLLNNHADSH